MASAHLALEAPVSRYGANALKQPPCGMADGGRTANVSTFRAGETISVVWDEYIDHPGHFRIAFDPDGDDDFVDPICLSGCETRNPVVEMYSNDAVLLDDIEDASGGSYSVTVTLPNMTCSNCTLQVIQVMYDKPPYTIPGNEMYYQCADLVLVAADPPADAGTSADAGTGGLQDAGGGVTDAGDQGCRALGPPGENPATQGLMIWVGLTGLFVARRSRGSAAHGRRAARSTRRPAP